MPNSFRELAKRPLELFICLLLLALVCVTFAQVISRYFLQVSLSWSEEAARFLMIWLGMVCAGYAFKFRAHFSLRFFVERLTPRLRRWVAVLVDVVLIAFALLFIYQSYRYLDESVSGMRAPALGIPMEIPFSAPLFGGLVMLFYVARNAWRDLANGAAGEGRGDDDSSAAGS